MDAFVPYKREGENKYQLFGTENSIAFGMRDLVLEGDFDE
jgi:hypothetical protein